MSVEVPYFNICQKTDLACFAEVWLTALGAVNQINWQSMKKQTLLINFFRKEYYDAYDEMLERLHPLLLTPQQNPRLVERLDFRPDLPRGSKKIIYTEIARLLQSGDFVLARGFTRNDLFRWLTDPRHSNLGIKWNVLQILVYQRLRM